MKKTSIEFRQMQAQKRADGEALVELAANEERMLTAEENTQLRAIKSAIEAFDAQIADAELRESFAKKRVEGKKTNDGLDPETREIRQFSIGKVMAAIAGNTVVDGFEREMLDESQKEAREYGLPVGKNYIGKTVLNAIQMREIQKRAMSAGSSTAGGNFIQTDKVGFFDVLRANRVLDKVGAQWNTGRSANIDYRGFTTGWVFGSAAENATAADADAVTAVRRTTPKRVAGKILISNQLLMQDPEMEGNIMQSLQAALYPYIEQMVLVGSGSSNQMTGITANSTAATVALGTNGGAPSLTYIQNMIKTLLNGNVQAADLQWIINPNTQALLQSTPIDTGSGAMLVPYGAYFGGADGLINNYKYHVTSNLPNNLTKGTSSTNCSAVIAGDFSNLVIDQFGGLDLVLDTMTLAAEGQTRIIANSYWDTTIKRAGTIVKTLDLITG